LPSIFQFPLLGIFPCIHREVYHENWHTMTLSIPFAWDFSMHPSSVAPRSAISVANFQFPLLGIFPCIPTM